MPAIPKREAELARPRHRQGAAGRDQSAIRLEMQPVTVPNIPKAWHPIARRMFEALKTSGQAARFQNSDWAFAYVICDEISRYKAEEDLRADALELCKQWESLTEQERKDSGFDAKRPPYVPKGGSAMKLTTLLDAFARLGTTEIDRLKVRIELTEPAPEQAPASVIAIADARKALGL